MLRTMNSHFPTRSTDDSLGEQAYRSLRKRIVRLEYSPGDVLREDELREALDLGRTPIREALLRLHREHFVTIVPRRGVYVNGIAVDELPLLFETRSVLEPYAARLAAERGTEEHWEEMAAVLKEAKDEDLDDVERLELDRSCHELIWTASGNRFLWDTLDTLYAQSDRLWHLYLSGVAEMAAALHEHGEILTALEARDADGVERLVEAHVRSFDAHIRTLVQSSEDGSALR